MKAYAILTLLSPIAALYIKAPDAGLNETISVQRDDVKAQCGMPPDRPNTPLPASDYAYPISKLLKWGSGTLHFAAGPKACMRVSCNPGPGDNAGVIVCSDAHQEVDIMYSDIAWFAQEVYRQCKVRHSDGLDYIQKGQIFNPDAPWNVILSDWGHTCPQSM
ncbi:hypothetical protein GGR52DRAFT_574707 [Hypoxylon sp. FL1284]|nr:hypothetical protein GGR52DRAFT_574707 [Hypoxylon sp. FL1284]